MKAVYPLLWFAVGICLATISCPAQETVASEPPPISGPQRQNEDYTYLENPSKRSGEWWESLKYIPVEAPPLASYVTLGGEVRERYEWIENSNFGDGPQDNGGYLLTRALPYISFTAPDLADGTKLLFFSQAQIAHINYDARGPGPIDVEDFGCLQGFVQLTTPVEDGALTFQIGRQVVSYGTERLIGSRYGTNTLLSFDGGIVKWKDDRWEVSAFYLRPVLINPKILQDNSHDDEQLWGIYATRQAGGDIPILSHSSIDLYYLGYWNDSASFASLTGRELRHTVGSRLFGQQHWGPGTLDWNYEGMLQFGTVESATGSGDILAWSVGTETGYTFDTTLTPRLFLRANIVSGNDNPGSPNLETFNPLFPKGKYFGELTPIGPYNLINLQSGVSLALTPEVSLTVQGGPYWRESTHDAVYGVGGNIVRNGSSEAAFIGTQWETVVEWKPRRELSFLISYSQFHPGEFMEQTGPAQTIHFAAVEAVLQF